ncbi:hypothetical protein SCUP515_03236 [Seiridium cupressi]
MASRSHILPPYAYVNHFREELLLPQCSLYLRGGDGHRVRFVDRPPKLGGGGRLRRMGKRISKGLKAFGTRTRRLLPGRRGVNSMAGHHTHGGGGSVVHSSSDEEPFLQTISEESSRSSIERDSVNVTREHGTLNVPEAPESLDAKLIPTSQHNWQSPQETQSEANRDSADQDPSNQGLSSQDPPNQNPYLED